MGQGLRHRRQAHACACQEWKHQLRNLDSSDLMIGNRLRGLLHLHVACVTGLALLLLNASAGAAGLVTFGKLGLAENLTPYVICIGIGMLFSGRFLQPIAARFHQLEWQDVVRLTFQQVLTAALVVFIFMFAFKDRGMSRLFLGVYFVLCAGMLLLINRGLPRFLARAFFNRANEVPTLLVGSMQSLDSLSGWMASKKDLGIHLIGFLNDEGTQHPIDDLPFLGTIADLGKVIDQNGVMQVISLEIPQSVAFGRQLLETCQGKGCRLLIYNNLGDLLQHPLIPVTEGGHQFYSLQQEPLEDPFNRMVKRLTDVIIALPVVLIVLPPLSAWVWLMQRIQAPGRLFFIRNRTGHGQRQFAMFKFRSMYEMGADAKAEVQQARCGDDRIYPFGRFLRKTSLDEFPQFINVLKGDMSVVGPRPHLVAHDLSFDQMMKGYRTRFFVKPGITGLAQCNGFRGEITDPELLVKRVRMDVTYVAGWSIWLDLVIIGKTARHVLFPPKTAY